MAKKEKAAAPADEGKPLQSVMRRPRICFERIIPDEIDAEAHVRRAMRATMLGAGRKLGALDPRKVAGAKRMALIVSKKWAMWDAGAVVRCRFLDGSARMQAKVRKHSKLWEEHANVRIQFVDKDPAEVRISFYADEGSWSAVGRDALNTSYFPKHQPTMNFGWVRDRSDPEEDRAVILHEFGHALGCVHEHQAPTFDRVWDEKAVMESFSGPPNYWDEDEIRANVLQKYSKRGVAATRYDRRSIMLYAFGADLFKDGKGATNENTTLSALDIRMIGEMYPKHAAARRPGFSRPRAPMKQARAPALKRA